MSRAQVRWAAVVAEHGSPRVALLYALHRVLQRLSNGRAAIVPYLLVAQPVGNATLAAVRTDPGTVVRRVLPGDPVIDHFPRGRNIIAQRFANGSVCYAAWVKGRFAGHIWIARERYVEDEVRCTYVLAEPDCCVWDYDVYIEPRLRFGRTMGRLWQAVDNALVAEGKTFAVSRINRFASGSVRSHQRLGAQTIGHLTVLRVASAQLCLLDRSPFVHVSLNEGHGPTITLTRPTSSADP